MKTMNSIRESLSVCLGPESEAILPASLSSSSCGVEPRLLDLLPDRLGLENHLLNRLAETDPSPKTSSII